MSSRWLHRKSKLLSLVEYQNQRELAGNFRDLNHMALLLRHFEIRKTPANNLIHNPSPIHGVSSLIEDRPFEPMHELNFTLHGLKG